MSFIHVSTCLNNWKKRRVSAMQDLSKLTLASKETLDNPYDYYSTLRRESPVFFDEGLQCYVVTRYSDVQEAARMTDALSNELGFDKVVRSPWAFSRAISGKRVSRFSALP